MLRLFIFNPSIYFPSIYLPCLLIHTIMPTIIHPWSPHPPPAIHRSYKMICMCQFIHPNYSTKASHMSRHDLHPLTLKTVWLQAIIVRVSCLVLPLTHPYSHSLWPTHPGFIIFTDIHVPVHPPRLQPASYWHVTTGFAAPHVENSLILGNYPHSPRFQVIILRVPDFRQLSSQA